MTALIRGDVHMAALPAISVTPQADAGKAKILAVSLPKRSPFLPNVPTLKESGIDVQADTWMGSPDRARAARRPRSSTRSTRTWWKRSCPRHRAEKLATQLMEPVGNSPAQLSFSVR